MKLIANHRIERVKGFVRIGEEIENPTEAETEQLLRLGAARQEPDDEPAEKKTSGKGKKPAADKGKKTTTVKKPTEAKSDETKSDDSDETKSDDSDETKSDDSDETKSEDDDIV